MTQKFQYLQNVLKKDAQRFYQSHGQNYAASFQQAVAMIEKEYNSPVPQAQVKLKTFE